MCLPRPPAADLLILLGGQHPRLPGWLLTETDSQPAQLDTWHYPTSETEAQCCLVTCLESQGSEVVS